jgi:hypothetical protein
MTRRAWTQDQVASLRRHYATGATFSEIGEAIARPRGSCVAKAHKLGLVGRDRSEQGRRGHFNRLARTSQTQSTNDGVPHRE